MGIVVGRNGVLGAERGNTEASGEGERPRCYTRGASKTVGKDGLFKLLYQYGDHNIPAISMIGFRGFGGSDIRCHMLFSQVTVKC